MQEGEIVANEAKEDSRWCTPFKLGLSARIDDAHIFPVPLIGSVARGFNHARRQIHVGEEGLFVVQSELVTSSNVLGQASRFDVNGRQPIFLRSQKRLGASQILVHVRSGTKHDGPEVGDFAAEVVVDGGGRQQHQLGRLEGVRICFELFQCRHCREREVLADATSGDIVVCAGEKEDRSCSLHTTGQQVHVLNTAFEHLDLLVLSRGRHGVEQLGLVSTVGVNLDIGCVEQMLNDGSARVSRAAHDGESGNSGRGQAIDRSGFCHGRTSSRMARESLSEFDQGNS